MKSVSTLSACMFVSLVVYGTNVLASEQGVYFMEPKDGAVVDAEVKVVMGVRGMEVKPAGSVADGTGHHHLLIDAAQQIGSGEAVPKDAKHLHFGKGQTEARVELTPGVHTLTLQFANGAHASYGETMRSTITVTVKDSSYH